VILHMPNLLYNELRRFELEQLAGAGDIPNKCG